MQIITNAHRFAEFFNSRVPGAYRRITERDALDMKICGLIGHSSYYGRTDLEVVRGILQYEQKREKRSAQQESADGKLELPTCRLCGQPLPTESEGTIGRPREYCSGCESFRNKDRQKKWRLRRRKHSKLAVA